jgi:hypothetical protein
MKTRKPMKVKELMEKLGRVNPEAEIKIYYSTEIWDILEVGGTGGSFLGDNHVWIIPEER